MVTSPSDLHVRARAATAGLPRVARDGDCLTVAPRLAAELGGVEVIVWGWVDDAARVAGFVHQAVQVGGMIVDATATQFDVTLPMPWVIEVDRYCTRLAAVTGVERVSLTPAGSR